MFIVDSFTNLGFQDIPSFFKFGCIFELDFFHFREASLEACCLTSTRNVWYLCYNDLQYALGLRGLWVWRVFRLFLCQTQTKRYDIQSVSVSL